MLFPYSDHCHCKRTDDSEKHAQSRQYHSAEEPTAVIRRRIGGIHLSFCACLENRTIVRIFGLQPPPKRETSQRKHRSLHPSLPFPVFPEERPFRRKNTRLLKAPFRPCRRNRTRYFACRKAACAVTSLCGISNSKLPLLLRQNGDFAESGL